MVKFRRAIGRIAAYVGHLSQISIDADKDWKGKKITNLGSCLTKDEDAIVISDTLVHSNDAEKSHTGDVYTKIKEIKLNAELPAIRVKFDLKSNNNSQYWAKGTIYKNGVAIGTERSILSLSYSTFSEDFTGFTKGDLLQVYARNTGAGYTAYVQNLRIYYDETTRTAPTNQDP